MSTDPDRVTGWRAFVLAFAIVAILVLFMLAGHFWPVALATEPPLQCVDVKTGRRVPCNDELIRCQRKAPPWNAAECGRGS